MQLLQAPSDFSQLLSLQSSLPITESRPTLRLPPITDPTIHLFSINDFVGLPFLIEQLLSSRDYDLACDLLVRCRDLESRAKPSEISSKVFDAVRRQQHRLVNDVLKLWSVPFNPDGKQSALTLPLLVKTLNLFQRLEIFDSNLVMIDEFVRCRISAWRTYLDTCSTNDVCVHNQQFPPPPSLSPHANLLSLSV